MQLKKKIFNGQLRKMTSTRTPTYATATGPGTSHPDRTLKSKLK
jgi:hypothetical protein